MNRAQVSKVVKIDLVAAVLLGLGSACYIAWVGGFWGFDGVIIDFFVGFAVWFVVLILVLPKLMYD